MIKIPMINTMKLPDDAAEITLRMPSLVSSAGTLDPGWPAVWMAMSRLNGTNAIAARTLPKNIRVVRSFNSSAWIRCFIGGSLCWS